VKNIANTIVIYGKFTNVMQNYNIYIYIYIYIYSKEESSNLQCHDCIVINSKTLNKDWYSKWLLFSLSFKRSLQVCLYRSSFSLLTLIFSILLYNLLKSRQIINIRKII